MASASLCGSVCVCVKLLFLCLLVCQFVLPLFHSRLLRYCLPLFRQSGAAFVVLYCTIVFNWSSAESATATVVILRYISVHIIITGFEISGGGGRSAPENRGPPQEMLKPGPPPPRHYPYHFYIYNNKTHV